MKVSEAPGSNPVCLESSVISSAPYATGGYADIDNLFQQQAEYRDRAKREAKPRKPRILNRLAIPLAASAAAISHALFMFEADENQRVKLLDRWQRETDKACRKFNRIAVAFEAGRDGFWLGSWMRRAALTPMSFHAASVAVSREHRRAKTDRSRELQLETL